MHYQLNMAPGSEPAAKRYVDRQIDAIVSGVTGSLQRVKHFTGGSVRPWPGVIWCRGMTEKPVIPRPPKVPPGRHEQHLRRQISPAELAQALKAHRRWLKNGPAGGSRLDLNSCDLTGVALQGALLSRAGLNRAVLSGALLSNAKLERAELSGAELEGALLDRADLKGARVSGANLRRADLTATHAPYLDAEFADFSGAQLDHVDLTGADLSGAIMAGANLTGARLSRANLRGADLRGARLTGADLREAKLGAADLRGADLTGADLRRAYMRLARLDDANLAGADLTGAAWLSQAQLDRARVDEAARLPEALTVLNGSEESLGPSNGAHGDG
jgi:uncharacterized protein YjbI with pentapeptide repeats